MAKKIMVSEHLPEATGIRDMFVALGCQAELWDGKAEPAAETGAFVLNFESQFEFAATLRKGGFAGAILVLGKATADLDKRQRLAELKSWFMPAYSGPGEVVARVRLLLT